MGFVTPQSHTQPHYRALIEELGRLGFTDGKNLQVDRNGFDLKPEQYASHAKELVDARVDLIFSGTEGIVQSMARPGGNITGVSLLGAELDGKRQEILLELLPGIRHVAVLADPGVSATHTLQALEAAARTKGLEITIQRARTASEIASAIDAAKKAGATGLNVLASVVLFINRRVIFERTAALGLPAIYQWPEYVHDAAFAGYGPQLVQVFRDQMAALAAAILLGIKPGDLPVQQPTRFQLAINLKTAKALGITVPAALLARADEVIE